MEDKKPMTAQEMVRLRNEKYGPDWRKKNAKKASDAASKKRSKKARR